jgi:hypothetical protein
MQVKLKVYSYCMDRQHMVGVVLQDYKPLRVYFMMTITFSDVID